MSGTAGAAPYTVRIFLPFGEPDGMRIFDSFTNTVIGVVFRRTGFGEAANRRELANPGVYILIGDGSDENSGASGATAAGSLLPTVYIGEGDPLVDRLKSHNARKDFWTWAIAFTSKGDLLNKAHIQYIEHKLVALAAAAKRCNLDNGNIPQPPAMSEADRADCDLFLNAVLSILPLAGLPVFLSGEKNVFRTDDVPSENTSGTPPADTSLYMTSNGARARGKQTPSGFVVAKGSEAVLASTPGAPEAVVIARNDLIKNGVLVEKDGRYVFSDEYVFTSPSSAACVIAGTSMNGRISWKDGGGKTLKSIQEDLAKTVTDHQPE